MKKLQKKQAGLARRHRRVRGKISGTAARPRLCVTRSNSNLYVQFIDDVAHVTICGESTLGEAFKATGKSGANVEAKSLARRPLKLASPRSFSTAAVTCTMAASRLWPMALAPLA